MVPSHRFSSILTSNDSDLPSTVPMLLAVFISDVFPNPVGCLEYLSEFGQVGDGVDGSLHLNSAYGHRFLMVDIK